MKLDIPSRHAKPPTRDPGEAAPEHQGSEPAAPAQPAEAAATPAPPEPASSQAQPAAPAAGTTRQREELGPIMTDAVARLPRVHLKRPPTNDPAQANPAGTVREGAGGATPTPPAGVPTRTPPWKGIGIAAAAVAAAGVGAVTLTRIGGGASGPTQPASPGPTAPAAGSGAGTYL